jgi:flagellar basal-body rod modification protein FlgD
MTSIDTTNPLMAAANTAKAPQSSSSTGSSATDQAQKQQSEFLTLLVTQLKQQNPLDPTDGTQFVTQLAQFSSLNELVNIRATLQGFGQVAAASAGAATNPFQGTSTDTTTTKNSTTSN